MRLPIIASIAVVAVATPFLVAFTSPPPDIGASPYEHAILELYDLGIVRGYPDRTFRPTAAINRAELLQILIHARYPDEPVPTDLRCFTDLEVRTTQWYAPVVCTGRAMGIVRGYPDGTFKPEKPVNLAEALTMAATTFRIALPPLQPGQAWYTPVLTLAKQRGILPTLLNSPAHLLTRGEMAELTSRFLTAAESTNQPTTGVCGNLQREGAEQCDDGNLEDGDGCSKICIVVPEPIRHAALLVEQQAAGAVSSVTSGRTDVSLLKFTALAGRQDAVLHGLRFAPSAGSLLYAQHYTLVADTNADGVYETTVERDGNVQADRLIFESLLGAATRLPDGKRIAYMVHADIPPTQSPVSVALRFAIEDDGYIEATGALDGLPLTGIETNSVCNDRSMCWIRVHTTNSTNIDVAERGNMFVTTDTLSVRSRLPVASTVTDELLRLRMRGENEAIEVTELNIDGAVSAIDSLLLYKLRPGERLSAGSSSLAQATTGQCDSSDGTRLCAKLSPGMLVLQPNEEVVIAVTARLKSDQSGGISGQSFALRVSAATDTNHAIEAHGLSSSKTLTQNNGDSAQDGEIFVGTATATANALITGQTHDIALAGIQTIVNGRTDATATGVPSGMTPFAAFRFSTANHTNSQGGLNDVVLKTLVFRITAQNVRMDQNSFRLAGADNPSVSMDCAAGATTGSFDVTCSNIDASSIQSHIAPGTDVTYQLYGNVTDTQMTAAPSTLTAELALLGQRSGPSSVTWSDQTTTFSWVDVPVTSVGSTVYRQ